jgi:hypothetical protein
MLFELAVARAEQLLRGVLSADWGKCLSIAVARQRQHFAARPPAELVAADKFLADWAASNLCAMLTRIQENSEDCDLEIAPEVSGYRWIAAGRLDFSVGPQIVEFKNPNKLSCFGFQTSTDVLDFEPFCFYRRKGLGVHRLYIIESTKKLRYCYQIFEISQKGRIRTEQARGVAAL